MRIVTLDRTKNILTYMTPGDKIGLMKVNAEEFVVTTLDRADMQTKQDILKEQYGHLLGRQITVSDAAEKYEIHRRTIFKWIDKGYISVVEEEPVKQVDEAEVKYCVDIYRQKKEGGLGFYGAPLLDEKGLPYQLKRPDVAEYRRRKNQD